MFSKSRRFGDNLHGASCPGPTTYNIKCLFDDCRAQQPKQRALVRKALPMLLGKKPPMFFCKKRPSNDSSKVESKNAVDSNDWSHHFDCNSLLAQGATGIVFAATLKAQGTPCALKRILKTDSNEKMVIEFFREFEILIQDLKLAEKLAHRLLIGVCLHEKLPACQCCHSVFLL